MPSIAPLARRMGGLHARQRCERLPAYRRFGMRHAVVGRAYWRGGVLRRPRYPSRVFSKVGGVHALLRCKKRTPPLCSPHGGVPPPPEGAAPGGFPLGLLLAGVRKETPLLVGSFLTVKAPALCRPTLPGGFARGLVLALRSLNARVLRAFLRRFKLAAQSRSHAGCALGGDRLATTVCGLPLRAVVTTGHAHLRLR